MNSDDRNKASFKDVDLTGAKVAGQLIMLGASIDGLFIASRLKVGDNLFASSVGQYQTRFRDLILNGAEIAGTVSFIGAGFDGALHASQLQVGGTLFMNSDAQNKASFKDVDLTGAKVTGSVHMGGASFDGVLEASFLQVGGSLLMASIAPNRANFEDDVNLRSAKIAGQIDMTDASFDGGLNADYLQVGGHLFMRQAHYAGDVVMVFAHVGGNLDLRGATLARLDLSGASVAGELRLGSTVWTPKNGESGSLDLRNTNVGNLMDAKDAWPAEGELHLNGFTFGRLGGSGGQAGLEMRARGMEWWDNWVRLDPDYSPILYEQLAAAFTSSGDRNAANEIRYLGLERKRTAACEQHAWTACLILTTQSFLTGYGIGLRVLYSVIFLSLASAALLWGTVPAAKQHGFIWCFGASLAQLLPVIQLNKEFTEFFYDPERTRLKGWQVFVFSSLGVIGLALGATLIIAVSGLTQGP